MFWPCGGFFIVIAIKNEQPVPCEFVAIQLL